MILPIAMTKPAKIILWCVVAAAIAVVDFVTTPILQFTFFYLLPIAGIATETTLAWSVACSIGLASLRLWFRLLGWEIPWPLEETVINCVAQAFVFSTFAYFVISSSRAQRLLKSELFAAEKRSKDVLRSMQDGYLRLDKDFRIVEANPAAVKLLRYDSADELVGVHVNELGVTSEEQQRVSGVSGKGLAVYDEVLQRRRKDGTAFWASINAQPVTDINGNAQGRDVYFRDVTDRETVAKEREQFYSFFKSSTALMLMATPDGRIVKMNPAGAQMLGYSIAEIEGREFLHFVHPDDLQRTLDAFERQQREGDIFAFENRYVCKDGSHVHLLWRAVRSRVEAVNYAIAINVTQQRVIEQQLLATERQARVYFESGVAGMALVSLDGEWEQVNDRFCEMLGCSRTELIGMPWTGVTHPDDVAVDVARSQRLRSGELEETQVEKRFIRKNGDLLYAYLSVHALRDTEGNALHFVVAALDATERKLRELEEAKKLDEMKKLIDDTKTISGLIPICASCNNIRDTDNRWYPFAEYITKKTNARMTHGVCPDCMKREFPEAWEKLYGGTP